MPHISPGRRKVVPELDIKEWSDGELNYMLTCIVWEWIQTHGANYQAYARAIGAFECAKLELVRLKLSSYEDIKIAEHGSAYE